MNYNNTPSAGFQNYGAQPVAQQQSPDINWVQGEAGARSWIVRPGGTAWLMDSERDVFYIKTVDLSGMPLPLRVFDYSERITAPVIDANQPTIDALLARMDRLEKIVADTVNPVKKVVKKKEESDDQ